MVNRGTILIIQKYETLSLDAYLCPAKKLTIGWGHTTDSYYVVKPGAKITFDFAEKLLIHDLEDAERVVKEEISIFNLNENQYGALVSIAYNSGSFWYRDKNGNKIAKTQLLTALDKADLKAAAEIIKVYKITANGKPMRGLIRRRLDEYNLFLKPIAEVKPSMPITLDCEAMGLETIPSKILSELSL